MDQQQTRNFLHQRNGEMDRTSEKMYGHKWWLCWKISVQCGRELNFLHSDITVIILHGQILILYNWRPYLSITPRRTQVNFLISNGICYFVKILTSCLSIYEYNRNVHPCFRINRIPWHVKFSQLPWWGRGSANALLWMILGTVFWQTLKSWQSS